MDLCAFDKPGFNSKLLSPSVRNGLRSKAFKHQKNYHSEYFWGRITWSYSPVLPFVKAASSDVWQASK